MPPADETTLVIEEAEPAPARPILSESQTPESRGRITRAEWMLLITTVTWGASFALSKNAGDVLNDAAARPHTHAFGPMAAMGLRFGLAAAIWFAVVPSTRSRWTRADLRAGLGIGGCLAVGVVMQHAALARISESASAFLTTLSILFVAAFLWACFGKRPSVALLLAIAMAVPGVWLMSEPVATASSNFGTLLALAAAAVFAWHLILVNLLGTGRDPWKVTGVQFACVGALCALAAALLWPATFDWARLGRLDLWAYLALLILFPTFVSFAIMTKYQPSVSPARASLIYLFEPLFAALFAWLVNARPITAGVMLGGGLILAANALVELRPRRLE